jgi:hypothetical protein
MVVLSRKPRPRAFAEGVGKDAEVNAIFREPLRVLKSLNILYNQGLEPAEVV